VTPSPPVRYSTSWLALREGADARARARDLADRAAVAVAGQHRIVVHDLGCGTGSMARWLAPLLPGPQHWVLHDRDEDLLHVARATVPRAVPGGPVTSEARLGDVTWLTASELAGASLVTASALLDLLTLEEVRALAHACADAACPALLTLTVAGRVELEPPDPFDEVVAAAFDLHQRRAVNGRRLLGPDAVAAATEAFRRLGARVEARPSPWRLGPGDADLVVAWLRGWVGAAQELRPDLAGDAYLRTRIAEATSARLGVTVQHVDLFVHWH
jgi:trans-aconitate methyltransferase